MGVLVTGGMLWIRDWEEGEVVTGEFGEGKWGEVFGTVSPVKETVDLGEVDLRIEGVLNRLMGFTGEVGLGGEVGA